MIERFEKPFRLLELSIHTLLHQYAMRCNFDFDRQSIMAHSGAFEYSCAMCVVYKPCLLYTMFESLKHKAKEGRINWAIDWNRTTKIIRSEMDKKCPLLFGIVDSLRSIFSFYIPEWKRLEGRLNERKRARALATVAKERRNKGCQFRMHNFKKFQILHLSQSRALH